MISIRKFLIYFYLYAHVAKPVALGFVVPLGTLQRSTTASKRLSTNYVPMHHSKSITRLSMSTTAASTKANGRKRLAAAMAFLTGWADIAFFTRFKTFATMLTGNTMWMALAGTEQRYRDVAYYLCVITSYMAGSAIFRRTDISLRQRTLPVCAVLVAALFVGGDYINLITQTRWIPMMMFAGGSGIVNSLGMEVAGTLTFVVTGHLTKLVNQAVDRFSRTAGRRKLTEGEKTAVVLNLSICGGFFAGAAFASMLLHRQLLHRFGIFSAIGLSYAGLWLFHDMEALGGAWWLRKGKAMCDMEDDGKICDLEEVEATTPTPTEEANTAS